MFIDPIIMQWGIILGASVCAFMIGMLWSENRKEAIIENTIVYLVDNGFMRAQKIDGEYEILKLDEFDNE